MRLRGFAPLCQPMQGLVEAEYDESGKYYALLIYDRLLSEIEQAEYELDFMGVIDDEVHD
ncbi:MAG: hypothetical protein J6112_03495 [Clostridia bacterium]|nr:hypothetical protein [Clostridia bacterium]